MGTSSGAFQLNNEHASNYKSLFISHSKYVISIVHDKTIDLLLNIAVSMFP